MNSEVWHGVKPTDLEILIKIDHQILRYICGSHAKTPVEFLYMETGSLPIPFIVSCRRMIYLQVILKRDENELLKRVYMAQKHNPTEGDYSKLVMDDFDMITQEIDENQIIAISEMQFKNYIKKHTKQAAFKNLSELQSSHSKVRDIRYEKLEAQRYIISTTFNNSEIATLSALRSHTIRGVKCNFSSWYKPNLSCSLSPQCQEEDSQRHILRCKALLAELTPDQNILLNQVQYEDIYGNTESQKRASILFTGLLDIRERLQEAAAPSSGSSLAATPPPGSDRGP